MISKPDKNKLRLKRHKRIRGKISGTAERPRLSVFRSNKNIYAQLIDDVEGVTLASASTNDKNISAEGSKMEQAAEVGKALAETAAKKISRVLYLIEVVTYTTVVYKLLLMQHVKTD